MIFNDFTVTMSSWALGLEKQRAAIAADNIASSNTGGLKKAGNFDQLLGDMGQAVKTGDSARIQQIMSSGVDVNTASSHSLVNRISLDEEISDLSKAGGRYKTIAEALSRKFGLMTIVSRSR